MQVLGVATMEDGELESSEGEEEVAGGLETPEQGNGGETNGLLNALQLELRSTFKSNYAAQSRSGAPFKLETEIFHFSRRRQLDCRGRGPDSCWQE